MSNWFGICSRIQRNIGIVNVKNEKKHIRIIRNVNFFGKYPLSNLQKITCIILRNLFGLDLFSHQSCATGTLLLQKKIYPRKSSLNLKQLIFFMFLKLELFCENVRHLATSSIFVMRKAFRLSSCRRSGGRSYHLLRRIPGETVLKVKVPPVRIENSLSPLYGYRLFYSRRDFSDSLPRRCPHRPFRCLTPTPSIRRWRLTL